MIPTLTFIGRFDIDPVNVCHVPFITVSLPVVIEADDVAGVFEYANLRFIRGVENSGMGLFSGIIGWLKRS